MGPSLRGVGLRFGDKGVIEFENGKTCGRVFELPLFFPKKFCDYERYIKMTCNGAIVRYLKCEVLHALTGLKALQHLMEGKRKAHSYSVQWI